MHYFPFQVLPFPQSLQRLSGVLTVLGGHVLVQVPLNYIGYPGQS